MSKQDRSRARTPTDLEQMYDFAGMKKAIKNTELGINKTNKTLEDFTNATLQSFENIESQLDGNVATHFYSGVPSLDNIPANEWPTEEEKQNHLSDLYYDKDTGKVYEFVYQDEAYCWIESESNAVIEAMALANSAKDTADGKRRIFTVQPIPPYDNGDLWFREKEIFICQFSKVQGEVYEDGDFVTATKYTDDSEAKRVAGDLEEFMKNVEANYSTTVEMESAITKSEESITASVSKKITENVDILQQQIDGAIETFTGSVEPTLSNTPASEWTTDEVKDKHIGDLYIVNSDGGDLSGFYYRFEKKETSDASGNTSITYQWVLLKDNEVTKALQDAKEANERAEEIAKNIEDNYSTTVEMEAKIQESADAINLEVKKKVGTDELVAQLNLSNGTVELKGNRVIIESDKFKLTAKGELEATDGNFKGKIESIEGSIGSWKICDKGLYNEQSKMGLLTDFEAFGTGVWYTGMTYEELLYKAEQGLDSYPPFMLAGANMWLEHLYVMNNSDDSGASVEVSGGVYADSFTDWSQAEKKKNFEIFKDGLSVLNNIDIYKYNYKKESDETKKHIGLVIGNDFKYSEVVTNKDNTGVDIYSLASVCVKAIQELQAQVVELENKLKERGDAN